MNSMRKIFVFVTLFGLLINFSPAAMAQGLSGLSGLANVPESEGVTSWLSRQAMPLKSIEAGTGFEDLKPLKKVLKDARIVGLGEATHGTREFFQFKHRMVEFLVREMGFTVLCMEASYPAALDINEYVLNGKGDRDKALASQGLWAWDTKEVTALIEWMRQYNKTVPEEKKVRFAGFDMHNNELAVQFVNDYLRKVAPERIEKAATAFKLLKPSELGRQHFEYASAPLQEREAALATLNELHGFLSLNELKFKRLTSATEFDKAMQYVRILTQFADIYRRPYYDPQNPENSNGYIRDYYMAENIQRYVNAGNPQTKIILWAHNDHIGNYKNGMGAHLRQTFGESYYTLALTFGEGGFQAREMSKDVTIGALAPFSVGPATAGSVEWYFSRAGFENFLIDFRHSTKAPEVERWFAASHNMRTIGLGYFREGREPLSAIKLKEAFDGMVFIGKTSRATPNPTGTRGPWVIPAQSGHDE